MAQSHDLRIEPRDENLAQVAAWIESFCASHAAAGAREHDIQLVAEELFLNAVRHGGASGDERVHLALFPQPEGAALVVEAGGPPFDPLKDAPEPDTSAPLEDRPIGGLGLMLVREMTERAAYERVDGRNRLALVFGSGPFPPPPEAARDPAPSSRCRPRGVTFRIAAILLVLMTMGLATVTGLNYLKFERILIESAAARYDPVLRELDRAINDSLRGGLTLASTRTTQQLIDRSVAQFGGAFDLVVRDGDGAVLFAAGDPGGPVGTPPPPGEIVHDLSDPDRFAGHMSILQDGAPVGTLSLSHGAGTALADLPGIARELRRAAVVSLTLGLPLMGLVAILVLGRIEGRLHGRMLAVERGRHDDPLAQAIRRLRDAAPR